MSSGLRIRDLCQQVIKGRRRFSDTVSAAPCHVDTRFAPITFDRQNALVYPDVVSTEECECIMEDVENVLRRKRYEKGHWDAVITNYREAELNSTRISKESHEVFLRIRKFIQKTYFGNRSIEWLPCHGIDLKKNGVLSAHVDSVKFSGEVVAGLSLNSSSIMRLKMSTNIAKKRTGHIDLYLPPLSLYVLTGSARYDYTHELLPSESTFYSHNLGEVEVGRERRISVIFRDSKGPNNISSP